MINDFSHAASSPPAPRFLLLCPLSRNPSHSSPHFSSTRHRIKYQARLKDRRPTVRCARECARAGACVRAGKKRNTHVDPISMSRTIGKECGAKSVSDGSRIVAGESGEKRTGPTSDVILPESGRNSAVSPNILRLALSLCPPRVARRLAPRSRPPSPSRRILQAGNVPTQWRLTGCTWDNRSPG